MKHSEKQKLRMYAGNLSGLYGVRDVVFNDGRGKGVRALEMRGDKGLECTVLADRCLDIPFLSFKGTNVGLVTKVGVSAPEYFAEDGARGFLRQFNGGLLTTCGITASGAVSTVDGRERGLHGNIANLPAENVCVFEENADDEVALRVTGDVHDAEVFGEALVLRRSISFFTERNAIEIEDTVENLGFERYPVMNLYHINFGYPVLDADARCYFSLPSVEPRDETAASHLRDYVIAEAPEVGRPEECFIHSGAGGRQFAMLCNERLGVAAVVHYDADAMPYLAQWKCCHAGDYAMAFEPGVACFWGLKHAIDNGIARYVEPGESVTLSFGVEVLDDESKIAGYRNRCKESGGR